MCGIAGIISFNNQAPDIEELSVMAKELRHRGPDSQGHFLHNYVALAGLRLSIFDTSKAADQPFTALDKTIVFNGAIYNYLEIREELSTKGVVFKTNSDTEVLLAGYHVWGTDVFRKCNGMWACAIYDQISDKLILCRDRYGIKPLYHYQQNGKFYFASEIKAFTSLKDWKAKFNSKVAGQFLLNGQKDLGNESFFAGVYQVPSGHFVEFNHTNPKFSNIPYYQLENEIYQKKDISFLEAKEEFSRLFLSSVQLRTRSDVGYGISLSGGLDSSSIASLIHDTSKERRIHAFSSIIEDIDPELKYIRELQNPLNFEGHFVKQSQEIFENDLEHCIWQQDEPFGSMSILAQYGLFRDVKANGVKVILGGQGADEYLMGYDLFAKIKMQNLWNSKDIGKIPLLFCLAYQHRNKIFRSGNRQSGVWGDLVKKNFSINQLSPPYDDMKSASLQLFRRDVLPSLLHYEDRNSMAFGVESRLPFMDYRLVEFVFGLPEEYLFKGTSQKLLLRESMQFKVPKSILNRKDKNAYATQQNLWIKAKMYNYLGKISELNKNLGEILVPDVMSNLPLDTSIIWRIYCFLKWVKVFDVKE